MPQFSWPGLVPSEAAATKAPNSKSYDLFRFSVPILEYELPPNSDIYPSADITHDTDGSVIHLGILCEGIQCKRSSSQQMDIRGMRYYCRECDASYCGRCKADFDNHPYWMFNTPEESYHRYVRFQLPINESLLADDYSPWRMAAFEVDPVEWEIQPKTVSLI